MGPPGGCGAAKQHAVEGLTLAATWTIPPPGLGPNCARAPEAGVGATCGAPSAKEHSFAVSVKNSDPTYSSASSKKDTVHLNMRSYEQFSEIRFAECSDQQDKAIEQDFSNQQCKLATARNKPALLRVGWGENWDEAYRQVESLNEEQG